MTKVTGIPTAAPRTPAPVRPARIAPLPNLPLFHKVEGRKVVLAGSGPASLWKAELLLAAGADLRVVAGDEAKAALFAELASAPPAGRITVEPRAWNGADLDGAIFAFGDLGDGEAARLFVAAARARGVPVNMIDQTDLCDFQVGTIVNRAPVVLAISTDGAAPMLGQSIRARIESVLPLGLSGWARAAARWRPLVKARFGSFRDRRRFWERFTRLAWDQVDRTPQEGDREALFLGLDQDRPQGRVTLVGAGPGDPELLTLKAVRALQSATVILFDDLVGPDILELARREATRIAVGKAGHGPSCKQSEICERIVALARAGENVVRLKGGDPLLFGRATEELDACRAAGIETVIVPGISAAQGAAAALGFSLTERLAARRIQFVTGHGADGRLPTDIDWTAIADPAATTAIYMPRKTLAQFVAEALAAGLSPATPAVAVASATLPVQRHVAGSIADLPRLLGALPEGVPVIVILGEVTRRVSAEALVADIVASAA
ncbi:siroheme synthase CysG [Sphingosinicella terrae]|uniref:siroheme synthase CysG n=1 Tax=Sphingosinicella terrae TaxID=2172047 RepID=UPI000E0D19DA|nr:siroheme synthase CysG [Sphingosinicella terrae]